MFFLRCSGRSLFFRSGRSRLCSLGRFFHFGFGRGRFCARNGRCRRGLFGLFRCYRLLRNSRRFGFRFFGRRHLRCGRSGFRSSGSRRRLCEQTGGSERQGQGKCNFFHVSVNELRRECLFSVCRDKNAEHGRGEKSKCRRGGRTAGRNGHREGPVYRLSIHWRKSLALALLTTTGSRVCVFSFRSSLRAKYCSTSVTDFTFTRNWRLAR